MLKYGNIIYHRKGRQNLGDDMQLLAIEHMYKDMGVNYSEVVRVDFADLHKYDGERIILPMNVALAGYSGDGQSNLITCFSPQIYPVFLGISIYAEILQEEDVIYLKQFSPIGCRDYHTFQTMQKYHIPSYLFGCMTLTLPNCWTSCEKRKVICVDVSSELLKYIPKKLLEECEFLTAACESNETQGSSEQVCKIRYNKYINEAALVVTSRLHVALPCIAAGIPVVFAKDVYSYRFTGIDRLVHIYDKSEYSQIVWEAAPLTYEDKKKAMLDLCERRVKDTYEREKQIEMLNQILGEVREEKGENEYILRLENYLSRKYDNEDEFEYALWGLTQLASSFKKYIEEKWKNAKFVMLIDRVEGKVLDDIFSARKEKLLDRKNIEIIVCTDSAMEEANIFFSDNGIKNYFYSCLMEDEKRDKYGNQS